MKMNAAPTPETDQHDSDCATHNMPAYPNGECNCSAWLIDRLRQLDEKGYRPMTGAIGNEAADLIAVLKRERDEARGLLNGQKLFPIVGWAVHRTDDLEKCAMYPISEKDLAFDAAKRWGANITALCLHPDAPDVAIDAARKDTK